MKDFSIILKHFLPDIQNLRNEKDIKIVMTFDKPIDKIENFALIETLKITKGRGILLPEIINLDDPQISNGTCSFSIPGINSGYLLVGIKVNDEESFGVTFEG